MSPPELILRPDKLDDRSYLPSYDFGASDLGEEHLGVEAVVRDVPGWMRPEDALKLYELAHFAPGPILEIGAYHGKSAIVLALGARAGRTGATVLSVDVDAHALRAARAQVGRHGVGGSVVFFRGSARALARAARGIRPGLVFVDGDHSRAGVLRDLAALEDQVPAGTLLLFHDYDDDPPLVAVRDAVSDSWVAHDCDFAGIFGCCGLFVRRRGGPDTEPGPPVLDLLNRDSLHMRYLQRVRRPVGRAVRTLSSAGDHRRDP